MDAYSYSNVFDFIAAEFEKVRLSFLIVGGFAVNHYHYTRTTADIDILINEQDYPKTKPILEKGGYKEVAFGKLFARFIHDQPAAFMDLDILFVDPETFKGILSESQVMDLNGIKMRVPSLGHLMALKMYALKNNPAHRENPDLIDLVNLIRVNGVDVTAGSFRKLCLQYGTQEIYEKLLRSVTR